LRSIPARFRRFRRATERSASTLAQHGLSLATNPAAARSENHDDVGDQQNIKYIPGLGQINILKSKEILPRKNLRKNPGGGLSMQHSQWVSGALLLSLLQI